MFILVKPCNPSPEETHQSESSPSDPATDLSIKQESTVTEEAVLKPEGFSKPESEGEAFHTAMEQA